MEGNDIYYVERILDRRTVNGKLQYKIKWEDYPMNQSTWEPLENLETDIELVREYDRLHPPTLYDLSARKRPRPKKIKPKKEGKKETPTPIKNEKENEQPKEEIKEQNNNEEKETNNNIITLEENKMKYNIDDSLKKVTTVRKKDNKLMAAVVKIKDGVTDEIEMETNRLKKENPWILLDFYESKIKFT